VSIDTTFHPITPTFLVGVAALQVDPDTQLGTTTFRVRCIVAGPAYLTWGNKSTITAGGAPTAAGIANTLGMSVAGSVMYIEVPGNSWFISGTAAAFEITGGIGGVGG